MGHDDQPDYYEILGVPSTATGEEISKAFRRTMRAVHPDASGTAGLFRLVKTAYDTLRDPVARAAYDARRAGPAAAPEPEPEPEPEPQPRAKEKPKETREDTRKERSTPRPSPEPEPESGSEPALREVRIRPRFGGHWFRVAGIAAWTACWLAATYLLWPAQVPRSLYVLILIPVLAVPVIALQPAISVLPYPWIACLLPYGGMAVLAGPDGGPSLITALCAVTIGAAGLALAPRVVRRGQELDRLVDRASLDYQIFNLPGAGLSDPGAAEASAAELEPLFALDGLRVVHGLVPPQLPGQARCYVDHAVFRDDRLALVMSRRWPAATYAWGEKGTLTADGRRFAGGDTGIGPAVRAMRRVLPRGVKVRGFVAVQPADPAQAPWLDFAPPPRADSPFAGTPAQVRDRIADWLGDTDPVVDRRTFAALLPHIRRADQLS